MKSQISITSLLLLTLFVSAQSEKKFAAESSNPGPFASIGITDKPIVVNGFDVIYKDEKVKEYFGWGYNKETGKMEYVNEVIAENDTVRQVFDNEKKHRWLSMDPVLKAHESPYVGFSNNPIFYVDPDGRDGIASIKKAEPMIIGKNTYEGGTLKNPNQLTIKANYYYNASSLHFAGAEKALQSAVSEYNNSSFTIKGGDGQYYSVKFELTALPITELTSIEIASNHSMNDFVGDPISGEGYAPYGNTMGADISGMERGLDKTGVASFNKISLNTSGINEAVNNGGDLNTVLYNTFLHEIGHNIGGAHIDKGAMSSVEIVTHKDQLVVNGQPSEFTTTPKNKLTKTNVEKIASTIWSGGRSGVGEATRPGQVKNID